MRLYGGGEYVCSFSCLLPVFAIEYVCMCVCVYVCVDSIFFIIIIKVEENSLVIQL